MRYVITIWVNVIALAGIAILASCHPENRNPNSAFRSFNLEGTATHNPTFTATPEVKTETPLPQPTSTPAPPQVTSSPIPSPTLTLIPTPSEHYIRDITSHKQYFPLGCEAAAAVDWANYFGVIINEYEFQVKLPQSDNPDFGFVGGLQGPWGQVPPYSYGVHAGPIAALLQEYGLPAVGTKDATLEFVKQQISNDKPVIAWVIGNMVGGVPHEYEDKLGNKVTVAAYEHVVILTGFNDSSIRYMNNGRFYEVPNETFLNSWQVLGNMIVYMGGE